MKATVWLQYDLDILQADHEGMYAFLDAHEAQECSKELATFDFEYRENLLVELEQALRSQVKLSERDRV